MNWIRGLVRPLVTVAMVFVVCLMVYQGKEVPGSFSLMVTGVLGWYFYDRSKNGTKTG